jgi:hypothetical protein
MFNRDDNCHEYCCSRFAKYQDELSDDAGGALEGSIHPIFARENFHGHVDYEAITPSLRLASKILHCDAMVHFVTTMTDGILVDCDRIPILIEDFRNAPKLTDEETKQRDPILDCSFVLPIAEQITLGRRARSAYILQNLANLVRFELIHDENDKRMLPDDNFLNGEHMFDHGPLPADRLVQFKHGNLSRILIYPRSSYGTLLHLLAKDNCDGNESWYKHHLLMTRFQLAILLLHELGHAIQASRFGSMRGVEIFFDDIPVNEAGYTMEGLVLGGLLNAMQYYSSREFPSDDEEDDDLRPFLVSNTWPSYWTYKTYMLCDLCIASVGGFSKQDRLKRISTSYVKSLFTQSFWDTVHERGMTALHPESFGEWIYETAEVPNDWTPSDPDPALLCGRYSEFAKKHGLNRAHKLFPCPNANRKGEICEAYIPPGNEEHILSTSIEGLVDGLLEIPIPSTPPSSCYSEW